MNNIECGSGHDEHPKSVLVLYQTMWGFLYDQMIPRMRRDHGTRFIILCPSGSVVHLKTHIAGPEDEVIDIEALEKTEEPLDRYAAMKEGARNEVRYNVSYIRDLAQQIRGVSANYLTHAPVGNFAFSNINSWHSIVHALNLMFDYFDKLLRDRVVDLVICRPDIALSTLTCVHVAVSRGIPVTFGKGARYKDYLSWSCGPYAEGDLLAESYETIPDCAPTPREELVPPGGSDVLWQHAKNRYSLLKSARAIVIETIVHIIFRLKDFRSGVRRGTRRLSYCGALRLLVHSYIVARWLDKNGEADIEAIASQPYVLFLLPQEPEFAIQSLCREFPHTFIVAQQIAMCLPPDTRLVIKEHSMLTGRRLSFYQDLLRLPNVVLAHRLLEGIHLADRCAAVATMSGTTGLEGTLLGKQVVVVGRHVEYAFLPNVHRVQSFDDLPKTMREVLRERKEEEVEAVRRSGSKFRSAVAAASFTAPGTPPLRGERQSISDAELERAIFTLLKNFRFQKRQATQQMIAD